MTEKEFSTASVINALGNIRDALVEDLRRAYHHTFLLTLAFPHLPDLLQAQTAFTAACHPILRMEGEADWSEVGRTAEALARTLQNSVGNVRIYICQEPVGGELCGLPLLNGVCDHGGRL